MTSFNRIVIQFFLSAIALFSLNAGAAIVNRASTSYAHPAAGTVTVQSNVVRAAQPDTITYYTSASFSSVARATRTSGALYVQIDAAECNANPAAAEVIGVTITSQLTGDSEQFSAMESEPDSGVFRISATAEERRAVQAAANAAAAAVASDDVEVDGRGRISGASNNSAAAQTEDGSSIEVLPKDVLTASVNGCGSGPISTNILVDPIGIVYDSKTNQPIPGATVTLIDVTGAGNGGNPGGPAVVFDVDGVTRMPSTDITDAGGMYHFPLVAPSLYRLVVIPTTNYGFPSKVKPGDLPASRETNLFGSYGGEFTVSAASGVVTIDVPLDPIPGVLYLEKNAARAQVEVGDVLDYTIRAFNTAEQELTGVVVEDTLPAGFSLVPGTMRLDGAPVGEFQNRGPQLRIPVGRIDAKANRVLRYRVRIGAGALQGDGINRAQATSTAPLALTSGVAAAKVKVSAGVFSEKGYIIGNIFADCNGNGLRDKGELGVPNVRVWLEDGSFSQTDADGRYSFSDVSPRTHVAKVDGNTLPAGATLAILSNRNAGDAGSRFVDLKDGELAKADFAIAGCSAAINETIAARAETLRAAARAAAEFGTAAPEAPEAAAKADLAAMDNSLGFVDLVDGAVLTSTQATVRVKGTAESTVVLSVNGDVVPDTKVGQSAVQAERQLEVRDYVGVTLEPGRNTLEIKQVDAFGNARGSRTIEVVAPGALARLSLSPQSETAPADGQRVVSIRVKLEDAAGVTVAERTAVTLDTTAGEWEQADLDPREPGLQVFIEGGNGEFALRAPAQAAEARLLATSGELKADSTLRFVPDLRPLVAAGVIEGAVSFNRARGNTANPRRDFDGFEDRLRQMAQKDDKQGMAAGARAAMFAKGQVGENTLLTMSYDTDKDTEPKLFRDIDPLAYYPTYGDESRRGFEAQSTSRLFVRAERERSWIMYGDFVPPGATAARNLGAYTRNLTGLRQHAELGGLTFESFLSYDSTRQMVEEIAANGTSGPFLTGGGLMVINSERVEIVVRDRNQTGLMLSRRALMRYVDYDIEPLTGRILLRAPVASLDPDLNPVSLRISYEVDQGSPRFWVGGIAAQYKINDAVEVGTAIVDDRNPAALSRLASVNATVKPDEKTVVIVEAAQMEKMEDKGRAVRVDATRNDGKLESHLFAGRADARFDNPSSTLPKGRTEGGARVRYRFDERTSVNVEALHTGDLATDAKRNGVQVFGGYTFANGVQVEAGVRHAREESGDSRIVLANPDLTSVRAKVAMQIPGLPQAGVFVEAEQDVKDSARRMLALGGDYRFAGGSRVYGRHELISSLGSTYALNQGQERQATVIGIDTDYMQDGRVFSEYRAGGTSPAGSITGERQAEAALGLRNLWTLGQGVRANTSLERVKVLSGNAANEAIAVTGAIEVNRHPRWSGNARLELRHGEDSDGVLSTLGLAYKIDESWTFLGKNTLAVNRANATRALRVTELLQSGVAYRALESIGVNGLAKYEYKLERDDGLAALKRAVHAVSVNANWQLRRDTVVSARYAAKLALDRSNGLSSRTVSHLVAGRVTYEINEDWDIGATAQALFDRDTRGRQYAAGVEAGYQLQKNMWVSAGYNFMGFKERDLAGADATAKGLFARVRMKFDENTLQGLLSGDALK